MTSYSPPEIFTRIADFTYPRTRTRWTKLLDRDTDL